TIDRSGDVVAAIFQDVDQGLAHAWFVVDDENSICPWLLHVRLPAVTGASGSCSRKLAPCPCSELTCSEPLCSSTIRLLTARPNPVPLVLRLKKGSKACSRVASSMPTPVSV